jgi:hypothetical protein
MGLIDTHASIRAAGDCRVAVLAAFPGWDCVRCHTSSWLGVDGGKPGQHAVDWSSGKPFRHRAKSNSCPEDMSSAVRHTVHHNKMCTAFLQIALGVAHAIWHWLVATSAVMLLAQVVRLSCAPTRFPGKAHGKTALLLGYNAQPPNAHPPVQLLGVSILTFRGRAIADVVVEAVSPMLRSASSAEQLPGFPEPSLATIWLPILMLYMPVGASGFAKAAH